MLCFLLESDSVALVVAFQAIERYLVVRGYGKKHEVSMNVCCCCLN